MKKTISICLFAALLLTAGILFYRWETHREELPEKPPVTVAETESTEEPQTAPSMQVVKPYLYVLRDDNGFLTVYEKDGQTVLLETNIRTEELTEETRELLADGIYVQDEKELYDLLESYSS